MAILDTMPESKENRRKRVALIGNQFIVFWLLIRPSEYHNILDRYEAIAATVDDPILLARFKFAVGHCQWIFGLPNKSLPNITDALKLCEAAGNVGEAARYCSMLQWVHFYLGNFEEALSWKEPALGGLDHRHDLRWYAGLSYPRAGDLRAPRHADGTGQGPGGAR